MNKHDDVSQIKDLLVRPSSAKAKKTLSESCHHKTTMRQQILAIWLFNLLASPTGLMSPSTSPVAWGSSDLNSVVYWRTSTRRGSSCSFLLDTQ